MALCSCPRSPPLRLSYNHFVYYTTYDPAYEFAAAAAVFAAVAVFTCPLHTSLPLSASDSDSQLLVGYIASATAS